MVEYIFHKSVVKNKIIIIQELDCNYSKLKYFLRPNDNKLPQRKGDEVLHS